MQTPPRPARNAATRLGDRLRSWRYARVYRHTRLDANEMRHVREILRFILERHEPYGAVVLDRCWNVVMTNAAAARSLPAFTDPSLWTAPPVNLLRLVSHPLGLRKFIVNWDEVSRHLVLRAHRELAGPADDDAGTALLDELHAYPGVPRHPALPLRRPSRTSCSLCTCERTASTSGRSTPS